MAFTCNSCSLSFEDADNQRKHMKSEWHRYNLKRRVSQLPAIDEDSFNAKVANLKLDEDNAKNTKKEQRRQRKEAILEQKRKILETARKAMQQAKDDEILTERELDDSINSNVSDQSQTTTDLTIDGAQISEEDQQEMLMAEKLKNKVDIPITTCLFCSHKQEANFNSIEENISHMAIKHGLYIPEVTYLVNKMGLIEYLGEKIGYGNVCLCCNYQGKDIEAVREHMNRKRHMKIPYETEEEKLEISEFYDFSTSYKDYIVDVEAEADSNEEWEDVDDEDQDDNDEIPVSEGAIINNGLELILPSGKVLGHRSLQKYWRQNIPPERELSEAQGTVIAAESRHMLTIKDKQEFNIQKRVWKTEGQRAKAYDKKFSKNMNNQMHYRDQLLQ